MSYLSPLRFHFAGKFQAAPSTVNNDVTHFNNATFKPSDQQPSDGNKNGWWNPSGDAVFRLANCFVTSAYIGGRPVHGDPVLTFKLADTDRNPPAKMVDLDPQQQMVSQIWGMQIRLCDPDGRNVLRSDFELTSFTEMGIRVSVPKNSEGDGIFSAVYQSTLTNIDWLDTASSPFLEALRTRAKDGDLSIKFNVDGYNMIPSSPLFTYGRIVGTIGPHASSSPKRFTLGRHLMPTLDDNGNPLGKIYFCAAVVDKQTSKVIIDLGNCLPTNGVGGPQSYIGKLSLSYQQGALWPSLGSIDYLQPNWYEITAGVVALPADRPLTEAEWCGLANAPIALFLNDGASPQPSPAVSEPADGLYVRADQFVYRLNPGEEAEVTLWATRFGQLHPGALISVAADDSGLEVDPGWPAVAEPAGALNFPSTCTCDAEGKATLVIKASDPSNPRKYIDGQVYGVRPLPANIPANYPVNPWDFISVLVWDRFVPDEPVTWYGSLQPIFQQYANLYPVMQRFLDLSNYESICANLRLLHFAFGLEMENPNSMPVTRDLSSSKRAAILKWLTTLGPDQKPALGSPPVIDGDTPVIATQPLSSEKEESAVRQSVRGGKSAAMQRRKGPYAYRREAK